jgi:hypothetical protein
MHTWWWLCGLALLAQVSCAFDASGLPVEAGPTADLSADRPRTDATADGPAADAGADLGDAAPDTATDGPLSPDRAMDLGCLTGAVTPTAEACDTKDNDCDGLTDEGFSCDGVARFCLSGEACPWRSGCVTSAETCSRSGLSSDLMASGHTNLSCKNQWWDGHQDYYCAPTKQVYFQ